MRNILQVMRDTLYCNAPSVKHYPASLCGLELCFHKMDRNLRCLPNLRRLVLSHQLPEYQNDDQKVYRLPAGLACVAIVGPRAGGAILDISSCSKYLLIKADHCIRLKIVGQDKGVCQPVVMRLDTNKVAAWVRDSLRCGAAYHKW